MDRKGNLVERDNPKSLLLPGTLPLPVHTLIEMDEGSGSDDNLPSTIDLDAIKVRFHLIEFLLLVLI